ncbi:MAG TPA: AAA family ATPase [Clostridiales bacterium]|nr:AAA family ATPase [Clostridiales bacterium]
MEINRDYYLNQLIEGIDNGLVKIVTGIRRCGKSYLLDPIFTTYLLEHGIKEDHIIKLDLDERDNYIYHNPDKLNKYVKDKIIDKDKYYIILDEVQKVEEFESVLIGFLHMKNTEVYVTGSNSKFLSSDIITEFRGRGWEIKLYPLSFSEFYSIYNGSEEKAINEYYTYGGLPLAVLAKSEEGKINYLKAQKDNVYINDIVERNKVQNKEELEMLVQIIGSDIGSLTNPLKLSNCFKERNSTSTMTDKTIYNYLGYLQDAFIIEKARRFDVRGKKFIETPQKYYFTDMGIRNSFLDFRQSEEQSHIMENVIYLELKKRGYNVDVGSVEIREGNKKKQLEVDFIANKGNNKIYIQSALEMKTKEKVEQEQKSLLNINDFFKKIIIVGENINKSRFENGIIIMSIYDFLLDMDSLNY